MASTMCESEKQKLRQKRKWEESQLRLGEPSDCGAILTLSEAEREGKSKVT